MAGIKILQREGQGLVFSGLNLGFRLGLLFDPVWRCRSGNRGRFFTRGTGPDGFIFGQGSRFARTMARFARRFLAEAEPFVRLPCGLMQGAIFDTGNQIEVISPGGALRFTETMPEVFAERDGEFGIVAAVVDRTTTPAGIQFSGIHFFEQTVMMEHHLHGGGGFDRRVINEGKRQFKGHKEGTGGWVQ